MLRMHGGYGKDASLFFKTAQFLCRRDACSVLVRFDDMAPKRFTAAQPSDHSTETLIISNYDTFVGALENARRVRIEAEFYQDGYHIVDFDVVGLKWPRQSVQNAKKKAARDRRIAQENAAFENEMAARDRKEFCEFFAPRIRVGPPQRIDPRE